MNDVTPKPPDLQNRSLTVSRRRMPVPVSRKDKVAVPRGSMSWLGDLWRHRWFALFALSLVVFGVWQGTRIVFGVAVVVDPVKRSDLIQTVVASGHVETPYRAEIGSQITGTVQSVLVEEGERVRKGQPLIQIESKELEAAVVQAQGAVAQAESRLRQIREVTLPTAQEALKQAQATLLNAQQAYDRTSHLAKNAYATQAALDDAQKTLDVAKTVARTANLQVFTNSPGGSDYVMAETQLNQATANLESARSRLGYATIMAPRDGVLISRNVERGAVVQPGKALLVLAPTGDTQLVLQIDEKNLGLIALGQKALASADAFPELTFPAEVTYVNPGIDITRASVEVKLTVSDPPDYLRQDMTVSVDIEAARHAATLIVPRRDVHDTLSGSPWLMLVKHGRAHKQPVRVGLQGNTHVEVLDGVSEGDLVIPDTAGVRTGQKVRSVRP